MNNFMRPPSYRPPPPPPNPVGPTLPAVQAPPELVNILEDDDLEPYSMNGTKIMPKPQQPVAPTINQTFAQAPFYPSPVIRATPMLPPPKSNTGLIFLVMGIMILLAGAAVTVVAVLIAHFS